MGCNAAMMKYALFVLLLVHFVFTSQHFSFCGLYFNQKINIMKRLFLLLLLVSTIINSASAQSRYVTDKVEKHDVAVLIIDMQNDFVKPGAILCVDGAMPTVPAIKNLAAHARANDWKVIHVIRAHDPYGINVDAPRIPLFTDGKPGYCVPGTEGGEIIEELTPEDGDLIITKTRNSGFFQTNLDMVLRRMGVKTVILAGTQYPNCVRGTAADAMSYDYETVVCTDACSAKTPQVAEANIFDMKNMGIKCISLDEVKADYTK